MRFMLSNVRWYSSLKQKHHSKSVKNELNTVLFYVLMYAGLTISCVKCAGATLRSPFHECTEDLQRTDQELLHICLFIHAENISDLLQACSSQMLETAHAVWEVKRGRAAFFLGAHMWPNGSVGLFPRQPASLEALRLEEIFLLLACESPQGSLDALLLHSDTSFNWSSLWKMWTLLFTQVLIDTTAVHLWNKPFLFKAWNIVTKTSKHECISFDFLCFNLLSFSCFNTLLLPLVHPHRDVSIFRLVGIPPCCLGSTHCILKLVGPFQV